MVILSDANTVFIDHVLEAQALQVSHRYWDWPQLLGGVLLHRFVS